MSCSFICGNVLVHIWSIKYTSLCASIGHDATTSYARGSLLLIMSSNCCNKLVWTTTVESSLASSSSSSSELESVSVSWNWTLLPISNISCIIVENRNYQFIKDVCIDLWWYIIIIIEVFIYLDSRLIIFQWLFHVALLAVQYQEMTGDIDALAALS